MQILADKTQLGSCLERLGGFRPCCFKTAIPQTPNAAVFGLRAKVTWALGASYSAGLAVGFFKDTDQLRTH